MAPHAKQTGLVLDDAPHHLSFSPLTRRKAAISSEPSKSVTFKKSVKVQRVLHVADYTKEEIASTWYSSSEMSSIKSKAKEAAYQLQTLGMRKFHAADVNSCSRGLEHRTREGSKVRSQNKLSAIKAALSEQRRQRGEGVCDPNHLAFVYLSESRHCQVMAHEIGMDDEYVARR